MQFKEISEYWSSRHPGRQVAGSLTEDSNPLEFFKIVDEYRFDSNHYKYLLDGSFFHHSEFKNKKVLEVGCGLGADLQKFKEAGADVYAIDSSESAGHTLSKRFALINESFKFKAADFRSIPFDNESFDLYYSFGVLHHSPWIKNGIEEAYRVLKSDGEMIIMLYHKGFKYYFKKLFFRGVLQGRFFTKNKQEILNKFTEEFGDSPTTLVYSRREAAALLDNMFDIVETKVFRFDDNINLPLLGKVYPLRSLLPKYLYNRLERNFGWNLMIRAKKKS